MSSPAKVFSTEEAVSGAPLTAKEGFHPPDQDLYSLLACCLRSRDEDLWTEFIRRTQPVIAGAVLKCLRRWKRPVTSVIDDLVQETYVKLFAHDARVLRRFVCRHENALEGFLRVVAYNVVQDHCRGRYTRKRGRGQEAEPLEASGQIGSRTTGRNSSRLVIEELERRVLLQQIESCLLGRLDEPASERDRVIFRLYYQEGLTAKAIACSPSIGLSVKGIESTLLRLTRMVRHRINGTAKASRR